MGIFSMQLKKNILLFHIKPESVIRFCNGLRLLWHICVLMTVLG